KRRSEVISPIQLCQSRQITKAVKAKKSIKCECNVCHTKTIHRILWMKGDSGTEVVEQSEEYEFRIDWGIIWRVIQCQGCESISMQRDSWNSEVTDEKGRPEISTTYFPPRTFRELPTWIKNDVLGERCPP